MVMPLASAGTSTMLCCGWRGAGGGGLPLGVDTAPRRAGAPEIHHLRPLITYSSPWRSMRVSMLVASLDATSGSVIAKAERILPSSSGLSQRAVFLVGQARAFVARGGGAIDRQKQVPQPGSLRLGLEVLDGVQRAPALACGCVGGQFVFVGRLVRIDVVIHELEQLGLQFLGFGRVVKVHGFLLRW